MSTTFRPKYDYVDNVGVSSVDIIKNEPMLWQADSYFAACEGGPLTKKCMSVLYENKKNIKELITSVVANKKQIIVDTRVSMLMKGFYPSIPDWHCDHVERGDNGQPDLDKMSDDNYNYCCVISDKDFVSGTEFILDELDIDVDKDNVWSSVNSNVERLAPRTKQLKSGDIIRFNQAAIHRATPAVVGGWRFFFRLSVCDVEPKNEIRRQTQVYVKEGGW